MKGFRPTYRRSLAVAAGALLGVVGAGLFASPALACHSEISGEVDCIPGTSIWVIDWTSHGVGMHPGQSYEITKVEVTPDTPALENIVPGTYTSGEKLVDVQQIDTEEEQTAKLTVWSDWGGWHGVQQNSASVTFGGPCYHPEPTPTPEPSETPEPEESETPEPEESLTPEPEESEEPEGAGGELPVTGSQTLIAAGAALSLLALGGGLYLLARRRRIKFTA